MKYPILGVVACMVLGGSAGAAAPNDPLTAPIRQFVDSFNKGDMAAAAATHAPSDPAIIDEVAPHLWRGPGALQAWSGDLASDAQKRGVSDSWVTLGPPTREEINGDRGYVVMPALYTFKERGVAMREAAQITVALQKTSTGWLISGWAWSGPKPLPDVAAAKP